MQQIKNCAPECDAYVYVFKEVGQFSYSGTMVGEDCPFFVFVCDLFVSTFCSVCVCCCNCVLVWYDIVGEVGFIQGHRKRWTGFETAIT
jgi:hypothetical protein